MFCSGNSLANTYKEPSIMLTGSTPGDISVKKMFNIPVQTPIDFIRWQLLLDESFQFTLQIAFGEIQPNTMDFKAGGEKRLFKGRCTISANKNFPEIYQLTATEMPEPVSLVKVTANIFHLMTAEGKLMNGNGGWSYSLFRKNPVEQQMVRIKPAVSDEQSAQVIYDGRTPCREIAAEHPEMKVSAACFKLKWRLILNRDPVTFLPTTFVIRKVIDGKAQNVTGKWEIRKGTGSSQGQTFYVIEPDKSGQSISFLVADKQVLFFLNKMNQPYIGNDNFGFALNRN